MARQNNPTASSLDSQSVNLNSENREQVNKSVPHMKAALSHFTNVLKAKWPNNFLPVFWSWEPCCLAQNSLGLLGLNNPSCLRLE